MDTSDYYKYRAAIEGANDCGDSDRARELLRGIQADLIGRYGLADEDVEQLLKKFRYNV